MATTLAAVRIVCATTRATMEEFNRETLLGESLALFPDQLKPAVEVKLDNTGPARVGLAQYYNRFLTPGHAGEIALFIHDDVYLDDWCLIYRLREAMRQFDVAGVAGNAEPDFAEPSWCLGWNKQNYPNGWQPFERLSGAVAHLSRDREKVGVTFYGESPRACKLLDGLFIAVNVDQALARGVRFDEQFEFHFYDMDFCRTALERGLRIGTWPIPVTHASGGAFQSQAWLDAMKRYSDKWPIVAEEPEGASPGLRQRIAKILGH